MFVKCFIMESGEGCVVMPASMVRKYKNPKIHTLATHRPEAKLYFMAMWKKEGEHRLEEMIALRSGLNIETFK